jgi:hypothetical protein
MNFDFAQIDTRKHSETGMALTIRKPDGSVLNDSDGNPVSIMLLGPDSSKYRQVTRDSVRKRLAQRAAGNAAPVSDADIEEAERDAIELLVACTVSWQGVRTPQGEVIPCTPDNARALYVGYPVVREQAESFIANRVHFTPASPTR